MKISELLDGIRTQDIVLPEFQREYVWNKDQAKKLTISLVREYPVGSLLFWKTDSPPELKNVKKLPDKLGLISVILDGQQRLTTLYLLINGNIPPYYTDQDIKTDPRDLYFCLENGDFQYYQSTVMKGNLVWIRVVDVFVGQEINVFKIASAQTQDGAKEFELAQQYNNHLTSLKNIVQTELPVLTVPLKASLSESINIFDWINSQGTKLTDAELALTHVTGRWSQARRVMKEKIVKLNQSHYFYDLTFMVRSLTGIVAKRALYETIHEQPKEKLITGWETLSKILDYIAGLLPDRAYIHSTWDLSTTNVLVPIIVYLSLNKCKFPNDKELRRAIRWMYLANSWARYSGQTDQKLEYDVAQIIQQESPWDALVNAIVDQRGRIEIKPADMDGRAAQHPLYLTSYILAKSNGAMDWFNGLPLRSHPGPNYAIHSHHIFPTSYLYKHGYDEENHLHRMIVNEIANRAFLTADTNHEISNRPPAEYLPEVEKRYPGALAKQFVPMDPNLWKPERYRDFLEARRSLLALKMNEFFNGLVTEPALQHARAIRELVKLGESLTLEFKSTLQWDVVQGQKLKILRKSVLKTVAAFLNSEGGTLVIGVEDNGNIYGLSNDLGLVDHSTDKFLNLLNTLMVDNIGAEFYPYIKTRIEEIEDKAVCVIDVQRGGIPAFLVGDPGKEFYIRSGNTTRQLDPEETVKYIGLNWA
ncbi:MAG: DUF262 domain-containing protein [Anaerolineaceae bacterium]|nr:DUF262 domain-containing protein [Anaerolineaceae bacterium]